jgi:hypothetical protein
MKKTQVARLLAYVTGMVNQQLLVQNEYLVAENRILRSHLPARLRLTDPQRGATTFTNNLTFWAAQALSAGRPASQQLSA